MLRRDIGLWSFSWKQPWNHENETTNQVTQQCLFTSTLAVKLQENLSLLILLHTISSDHIAFRTLPLVSSFLRVAAPELPCIRTGHRSAGRGRGRDRDGVIGWWAETVLDIYGSQIMGSLTNPWLEQNLNHFKAFCWFQTTQLSASADRCSVQTTWLVTESL